MQYNVEIVESPFPEPDTGMVSYFLPGEYPTIESADVAGLEHLEGLARDPGELFYRVSEATSL